MRNHSFAALPLRKKIIYPIWSILTLGVFILGVSVAHFMGVTQTKNLQVRASILAQGVASNLSGALIFDDKKTGMDQMDSLAFDPEVIAARVRSLDDDAFAVLDRLPSDCQWVNNQLSCSDSFFFSISHPITLKGDVLGTLDVWFSKDNIIEQRYQIVMIFLFITICLSALALVFAHQLHRLVTTPLLSILISMQDVIAQGVTSHRLPVKHLDELGKVTHCFNDMLDNLASRDFQLNQAFQKLEDKNHYINQVLDSLDQGLLMITPERNVTYYNPAARHLLPQIEIENNTTVLAINELHIERLLSDFEPVCRLAALLSHIENHQRLLPLEFRHKATGQQYQVSTYPISGERHSLVHIEDISARYLVEQRQRMAEMIFDQNPSSLIVLSRRLCVEALNTAFIRYFGEIKSLHDLRIREPFALSRKELTLLLKQGFLKINADILSDSSPTSKIKKSMWLPCLITIKVIKNSNNKIDSFVVSFNDQTQILELKRLNYQTNHDLLTGLANRQNAYKQLLMAREKHNSVYILFLDLDGFKAVNDTFGHHSGDELLKITAQRLSNCVSQRDIVARLSGDEFLLGIFLNGDHSNNDQAIRSIINRLLTSVNRTITLKDAKPQISASIGVYHWEATDKTNLESALQKADKAMYKAKLLGKNGFCFAENE
ncbi:diguanylate cyclase domain-containing protein [Aliivibrio sp. SR45-2]|uniref:diguanylate cyclase domain-containing protein n=1 Tax=Aliivibrio sp. SR45-2 TaxID=2760931 RepID=UPI0015F9E751|nr:diguanylate cyclase [Aliivibrio sp. SR45-2]MBB1312084.1 diguanylate cyclase [Aliivibrio sp. SR45-2]